MSIQPDHPPTPMMPEGPHPYDPEVEEDDEEPPDESPHRKTYIAIDGITRNELEEADCERLERHVIEFMLQDIGKAIKNVRVIRGDEGVVEFDVDAS